MFIIKRASIAIASTLLLGSCALNQMVKMAEEQELEVNPSPLELHGDSVNFTVSATLPENMLKKNKLYTIKTFYKYGQPGTELETMEFSDTEFPNQEVEQPSKSVDFSFFYEEEMKNGGVYIQGVASNLDKTKFKETDEMEIAKGVITTSRLYDKAYVPTYADHGYNNKEELIPVSVVFQFDQGSAYLRSSEVRGESGKELDAFISAKFNTKTVTITGTHSPEGKESINERLSEDRAKVIKDFYFKKMKQYDYKNQADSIKFETKTVFQDWAPFKKHLSSYEGVTPEQKKELLSIVNGSGSFTEKQDKIAELSYYKSLLKDFYPHLRTSTTEILKVKPKKTDAEISLLAKGIVEDSLSADTLTMEELMYAATLTPLLDEKEGIYLAATKKDGSWAAHNNLGVVYLLKADKINNESQKSGLVDKASAQFEISVNKEEKAENLNNVAITYLLKSNSKTALTTFEKAAEADASSADTEKFVKAGLGATQIRYAKYDAAITNSSAATDTVLAAKYNVGLAQVLQKNYTGAIKTLDEVVAKDSSYAKAYYVLAVAHARSNQPEEMSSALKKAAELDSELKARAVEDLEFLNYREQEAFTSALK